MDKSRAPIGHVVQDAQARMRKAGTPLDGARKSPKTTSKRRRGYPVTVLFDEEQRAMIDRAVELEHDVRANWCRRILLRVAEETIEAAAARVAPQSDGHGR